MQVRFRRHRLHPADGELQKRASAATVWAVVGVLGLLLLLIILVPRVLGGLGVIGALIQVVALGGAVIVAVYARIRLRHRIGVAEDTVCAAANKDAFWSPATIKARVEALFEPYWRSVQQRDASRIAKELTPQWRTRLEEAFAIWIQRGFKPVLLDLSLKGVELVHVEDQPNPRDDRFVALVECSTSYHVTDTLTGDVVEGLPGPRIEKQAWYFVRGEREWLLDRVERQAVDGGLLSALDFSDFSGASGNA